MQVYRLIENLSLGIIFEYYSFLLYNCAMKVENSEFELYGGDNRKKTLYRSDLEHINPPDELTSQVLLLLTPKKIRDQEVFERPDVITPFIFPTFKHILAQRKYIRILELLPVKTDEEYTRYHSQTQEGLLASIHAHNIESEEIALARNDFPYFLPEDLDQYIIWLKNFDAPDEQIADFIARFLIAKQLDAENAVIFERPLGSQSILVRGTLKEIRHVHLWLPNTFLTDK